MRRGHPAWAGAGWLAGFSLAGWALLRLGRLDWIRVDWADPVGWLATADTETAVAALARTAGLAVVAWVLGTSLLYAFARMLGWKMPHWLSIGPIRRAVDAIVAGSLVVSTMAPAGALIDPGTLPPTSTPPVEIVDPGYLPVSASPAYVPTPAGSGDVEPGDAPTSAEPAPPAATGVDPTSGKVTVQGGDNFWVLATRHLEAVRGRSPTDAEIGPYWIRMVEANRDRIRSGDPDLIFPGEVLVLPPVDG